MSDESDLHKEMDSLIKDYKFEYPNIPRVRGRVTGVEYEARKPLTLYDLDCMKYIIEAWDNMRMGINDYICITHPDSPLVSDAKRRRLKPSRRHKLQAREAQRRYLRNKKFERMNLR